MPDENNPFLATSSAEFAVPHFFDIADRLVDLYVTYRRRYVMMINGAIFVPKKKDSGPLPLSNSTICKHLHRKLAVGVFAGEYSSKFICFDVDDGNKETVLKIIRLAEQFGVPSEYIYVSSSGGKGYHVEVFFDNLVYTEKLRIFYDWVILEGQLNPTKVEFRPTHTQAIKLPLSRHAKTGNICWFLDWRNDFQPHTYSEYLFEIQQMPADMFNALVDKCGIRKSISGGEESVYEGLTDPNRPKTREMTEQEKALFDGSHIYPDISKQGERHFLARSIAIYNRSSGMTQEESTKALEDWWRKQDKSITSTPDGEAIADIHSLVAWTFSEGFTVPRRRKKLSITKDMMRVVLSQETKTERKLLFLIACFGCVYGRMNMSYERIASYIGCSAIAVKKMIPRLIEEGWIRSVQGRTTTIDGKYVRKPNTYYLNNEAFEKAKNLRASWCFEEPLTYEAIESCEPDESGRMKKFIPELEPEGFTQFYYHIVALTVAQSTIKDLLTSGEIKALRDHKPIQTK